MAGRGEKGDLEPEVAAPATEDEQADSLNHAGEDGGGGEEQEEDEGKQEGDEDEEEEEEEEEGYAFRFESGMNPLDFTHEDATGLQPYERFERLEYEALAEKKRKALADPHNTGEGSSKKARLDDLSGATMEEIMEALNYGGIRRKSRKSKKRGRRKGSRKKIDPEVSRMLGDATLHYAHGRYEEAISVLNEVVRLAPNVPDSYHTLGLIYTALGNDKKAMDFYMIAASLRPKDSSLWELLYTWSIKQENSGQAKHCLSKAITAEPENIALRVQLASIYLEVGDYQRAAETYEQIQKISPRNVEALMTAAKLYLRCGKLERAIGILADYIENQSPEADVNVIDLLATVYMENNAEDKALKLIEQQNNPGKELDPKLIVKAGICHLHLGNVEKSESLFNALQVENEHDQTDLITKIADSYMSLEDFHSALKYYQLLEGKCEGNGFLHLKVAQCYLSLNKRAQAISSFYKGLHILEDNIGARIALASLLVEEKREDEAISLLSPPNNIGDEDPNKPKPWWEHEKVKLKLCDIYRAKGMIEAFVDIIFPPVQESLSMEVLQYKVRPKKRLPKRVLFERVRLLDDQSADNVFSGFRPVARSSDLLKASRAKRLLQKRETQKGELKASASESGVDLDSDNSEDELSETLLQDRAKESPFRVIWKDEEHQCLIVNLCKALAYLGRYWEALEIINFTVRLAYNILPSEKKDELQSVGAQIAYHTTDPKRGFDWVRQIVEKHPNSLVAWNCYYKVISRLEGNYSKHSHFLHNMRSKYPDSVPPIVISGHHFTAKSRAQDAAREYLEAYKMQPDNALVNLCVGTSLINLALGFRLKNKQQCLTQGMAFLFNNMKLTENSQEAMYNIARAFHHVGLVSFAVLYYDKVLRTREKDYPIPKLPNEEPDLLGSLKPGYCNLRREAAYNLHLIYKRSGAHDLARQILKDHCTF
ncbi:general transcription factor 3C polypeptide 3 isoform X2 [Punica granatum]|uniref:General transcription factor 3C polypeptide 3 isoform X2 n=1 Tax=Punica granatum TaxID=22663 RepID=A0A218WYU1_PUNGR|nr:general transcription factor 3C polypeptide 3 isoform X2 [Punica granatum]OWM77222.1 hypothetical protein CDL15_Pgr028859 [Punica granatum]